MENTRLLGRLRAILPAQKFSVSPCHCSCQFPGLHLGSTISDARNQLPFAQPFGSILNRGRRNPDRRDHQVERAELRIPALVLHAPEPSVRSRSPLTNLIPCESAQTFWLVVRTPCLVAAACDPSEDPRSWVRENPPSTSRQETSTAVARYRDRAAASMSADAFPENRRRWRSARATRIRRSWATTAWPR